MSRAFKCVCGQALYFRNSQCMRCGRALGYESGRCELVALEPAAVPHPAPAVPSGAEATPEEAVPAVDPATAVLPPLWCLARDEAGTEGLWHRCANLLSASACNWLVPAAPGGGPPPSLLCLSCRLNRTVPDLSDSRHAANWRHVEHAKRRLVSSLLELGLPVQPRLDEDPQRGLMFDLLGSLPGAPPPMTGHDSGLITINVDEADDLTRESVRAQMGEPYRTVLGHLRHEVGHYYWDRLVLGTPWHERYRELFGDETQDYAAALQRHYTQGAPADWPTRHITAYASAHPWEDWAETWAHYQHMIDGLDTAASFGLNLGSSAIEPVGEERSDGAGPAAGDTAGATPASVASPTLARLMAADFDRVFGDWLRLTQALNQMSRSLGERDFYPFVIAPAARRKLAFVHDVIAAPRSA